MPVVRETTGQRSTCVLPAHDFHGRTFSNGPTFTVSLHQTRRRYKLRRDPRGSEPLFCETQAFHEGLRGQGLPNFTPCKGGEYAPKTENREENEG